MTRATFTPGQPVRTGDVAGRFARPGMHAVSSTRGGALPVVLATIALMALAFITPLGSKGALLFLAAGGLLVILSPGALFAGLRENWVVVLMVTWCVVSFTWSDYPALSLRHGTQLAITVGIAIAIFVRVPPTAFVKIVFVVYGLAGVASLASGRARADGLGFLGLYGSKNALAASMSLLLIVSLAVLMDRRLSWRWRGPAILLAGLGGMLMVMGQSTGTLAAVAGVLAAFLLLQLLARLQPLTRIVVLALGTVLSALLGFVLASYSSQIAAGMLEATGKDVTLTGRTELWEIALREIAQRPWLGSGFQAVWVRGNQLAEELWAMFGIEARGGFHFHNTLLSNAVEIGVVGVALQAAVFGTGLVLALSWAIRRPSAASLFFALLMVRQALMMWLEVAFFFQFEPVTIMTLAALHYGRGFRRAENWHEASLRARAAAPDPRTAGSRRGAVSGRRATAPGPEP